MQRSSNRPIAIVGMGALLPDAPDLDTFWQNICNRRYSITEVRPDRWLADRYFDPDRSAPDKSYSKIGGWVRDFELDWKRFRIPPRVAHAMDEGQQWALAVAAQTLADYGYPERPLDKDRTGVILGTAMGGDLHLETHARVVFPEFAAALASVEAFGALDADLRQGIMARWQQSVRARFPEVTEDTMPGELPNVMAGRIANVLNLRGPSFITDAACASSLAALTTATELLAEGHCDAVLTGGVDRNMAPSAFVKFAKIGALSATGSRPFGDGADGFVMGEGCALFLLKRLADAEQDGDRIYAVIRGLGQSSDGKGKSITAPNPEGQKLAIRRAWENAGLRPETVGLIEAHGTSTPVGDAAEIETLSQVFSEAPRGSVALGSVKGNIGHLKAAAGAAGIAKAALALYHKKLPPTLSSERPNPLIDFGRIPFFLNQELGDWPGTDGTPRRAGVSAYGFGGTNFHIVLEEYIPGQQRPTATVTRDVGTTRPSTAAIAERPRATLRGIFALGGTSLETLRAATAVAAQRLAGDGSPPAAPDPEALGAPERLVIDFGTPAELRARLAKAAKELENDRPRAWTALQAQGIYRGRGRPTGKVAFLYPGQGSQYLNMGRALAAREPLVAAVFAEADRVMTPILGRPLTDYIFSDDDHADGEARKRADLALRDTAVTQPAMLTVDTALHQLLAAHGFAPDLVMGHSLGEYAALIAAGVLPFAQALEATAARGREMASVRVEDPGWMAAVFAPYDTIEATLAEVDGYVVAANINSDRQCVIGGDSRAVEIAIERFVAQGFRAQRIPVSHAFHTRIVAPAVVPLGRVLDRLDVRSPRIPLVNNVTGELCPEDPDAIRGLLQQQVAAPVQWVKGLQTLYAEGVRTFVEVGPKKALKGLCDDNFADRPEVSSVFVNHPKVGEIESFNQALCALFARGHGSRVAASIHPDNPDVGAKAPLPASIQPPHPHRAEKTMDQTPQTPQTSESATQELAQLLARALGQSGPALTGAAAGPYDRASPPAGSVVITGCGLGLPGPHKRVMDEDNVMRLLRGEQLIDLIPHRARQDILDRRVTRLVKDADGTGHFETVENTDGVIKLAGRPGAFDLSAEYGVPEKVVEKLDITSQLAMAAGLDALREAGIPLVQTFKRTSTGKQLPDRWLLPEALRDETGVIFASAFPGYERFADDLERFFTWQSRQQQMALLEDLRQRTGDPGTLGEIGRQEAELRAQLTREPYQFDHRFLFRVLAMGHSQFAEFIGARGPTDQVNTACASTGASLAQAEDWIRAGRCRRVIVIGADNITSDTLIKWLGTGFQAVGATALDDRIEDAVLPFDRRRHGMIIGMGAVALVVESEDAVRERGMRGIVEILACTTANSAFHGTRLDVEHVAQVMVDLLTVAERRFGLSRQAIAGETVFVSHETYTPARGGSAAAEITALRRTFGDAAGEVLIANTKGFTGHSMGAGIEEVAAVKMLEHSLVPPVANQTEPDPDLGPLNFSRGGRYPVRYALRLAAGFGSQIAMSLMRRIPGALDRREEHRYAQWLASVSGLDIAETEVIKRVLRIKATQIPSRRPAPSTWRPGTGPSLRVEAGFVGPAYDLTVSEQHRWTTHPQPLLPASPSALGPVSRPEAPVAEIASTVVPPSIDPLAELTAGPVRIEPHSAAAGGVDAITTAVINIVAKKTGYPVEMLELDLDLEADLGIDTVKQAETVAEIRNAFGLRRDEELRLRDYPTIGHVVQFVKDRIGATVTPPAAAADLPAAPEAPAGDAIAKKVIDIVARKTGYPEEMLEMDLDLEADLGIDTVKQAETVAEIRAFFDLPKQDTLSLRDYPTLGHVVQFVTDRLPSVTVAQGPVEAMGGLLPGETDQPAPEVKISCRSVVPAARLPLSLCTPTGLKLDAGTRVLVALDQGGVGEALVGLLRDRGVEVLEIHPERKTDGLTAWVTALREQGPIDGVVWLPALDIEPAVEDLDLEAWRALCRERLDDLVATLRALYDASVFLITATRLGGLHGYGDEGASAPLGGAVIGFAKAYARERPEALVKAVDFAPSGEALAVAEALLAEALTDPSIVEVGYRDRQRWSVTLAEPSIAPASPAYRLERDSVFLVTGAGGGITSAIVRDLAGQSGGHFYLLDLAPAPRRDHPDLTRLSEDREALKRDLIQRHQEQGSRVTPKQVEDELFALEREAAASRLIGAIEAAGGTAHYHAVDITDGRRLSDVVEEIRVTHGRIDVLLHAAGLEISRPLPNKSDAEFAKVFSVKADGFFNLLRATAGLPLGACVAFSSVAGRFGNAGQTDYSAANDLLCKLTAYLRRARPETRGLVIDWSAWADIGMATRGSIPTMMRAAGIDMIPPDQGIPVVRRELEAGTRGELVVAGSLGILVEATDPSGGLAEGPVAAWLAEHSSALPLIGRIRTAGLHEGLEVETELDPTALPFLYDHQVERDLPYLPGVMGIEAFGQLARLLAGDWHVTEVRDVSFLRPFKFYHNRARSLLLRATSLRHENGDHWLRTRLRSVTQPSKPGLPVQEAVHFVADVRTSRTPVEALQVEPPIPPAGSAVVEAADIYQLYFHGPAYQVLERAHLSAGIAFGEMRTDLPPAWPTPEVPSLLAPRCIELCFQTAGLWEAAAKRTLALPESVASVIVHQIPKAGTPLWAVVTPIDEGASFDAQVVDESGRVFVTLAGYRTTPLSAVGATWPSWVQSHAGASTAMLATVD